METANLWSLVAQQAASRPDALLAVDEHGRTLSRGELSGAAERVAAALMNLGVGPGTVVSWILPTWLEAIVLVGALARLGAVQNPILPILRERDVSFIVKQTRTSLLITPGVWRGFDYAAMARAVADNSRELQVLVVDRALPEAEPSHLTCFATPPPNADGWYFYTSGTTGEPKGARHTDQTIAAAARHMAMALQLSAADRLPMIAPITHVAGPVFLMMSLYCGTTLILDEAFEVARTAELLRSQQATFGGTGAPFITQLLAYQRAHPQLTPLLPLARAYLSGGAPKSPILAREVKLELKAPVLSSYGMTEAPMLTFNRFDDDDVALATTEGRVGPDVDLILVKSEGARAAPGEEGELRVKAPQMMKGYLNAALNVEAFDADGYFRTGDLGRLDQRGNVAITGRLKDIIIRNMENISAKEVEDLLFAHPKVADVAVIGVPDTRTGERVCAVIVPKVSGNTPDLAELCEHLGRLGLSKRKFPEQIELIDALPRTATGKVQKVELRKRYAGS